MLYILNIGNTNTQCGLYAAGKFQEISNFPTATFDPEFIPRDAAIAAAAVVPAVKSQLADRKVFWLDAECRCGIDLSAIHAATLGGDRLANLIALAADGNLPALCLDCGTAITIDILDAKRKFIGGAILPGRMILRKALFQNTALLPLLPPADQLPEIPGIDTVSAMREGIDRGAIGAVREIVTEYKKLLGGGRTVAVGGDSPFFMAALPELEDGGRNFTLTGILKAWEMNHNESNGLRHNK